MPRTIDYYFSLASPWAYIGHAPFDGITRRHGVVVNHKPIFLGRVFAETGGQPLPQRHPARQRYRMVELQRWREKRGLSFNLRPKFWPFEVRLADRFVIAITSAGIRTNSCAAPSRASGRKTATLRIRSSSPSWPRHPASTRRRCSSRRKAT
jgi:2-hydroxychromene-2-carboxylate isomerase